MRQHLGSAGFKKSNHEEGGEREEKNVQHGRVIETDRCLDDLRAALRRNQPEQLKEKLDQQRGKSHGNIKNGDDEARDFPAVILAVDIDDWQHDEIGVN